MSISEIIVKVLGVVLAIFGLSLIVSGAAGLPGAWLIVLIGVICMAGGIYIVRGGNFSP